jgi:hypothetical protein
MKLASISNALQVVSCLGSPFTVVSLYLVRNRMRSPHPAIPRTRQTASALLPFLNNFIYMK